VDAQILQFVGSLIAIFLLAALAKLLGLGGGSELSSAASVQRAANEVVDGFVVADFAVDANGESALALDSQGQVMVLKRHGNRIAGRLLQHIASAKVLGSKLIVDSGEARYGTVVLHIDNHEAWVVAIDRLSEASDG